MVAEAVTAHGHDSRRAGVVASALAIDPRHWELLSFTLWAEGAVIPEEAGDRYQVLHLSVPERDLLVSRRGRG